MIDSIVVKALPVILLGALPLQAFADGCSYRSGYSDKVFPLNLGSISVPHSAKVGATVYSTSVKTYPSGVDIANCTTGINTRSLVTGVNTTPIAGYANTYAFGVPGYGIRIQAGTSTVYYTNPASVDSYTYKTAGTWSAGPVMTSFEVAIIKVAESVSSGTVTTGNYATFSLNKSGGGYLYPLQLAITGGVIQNTGCRVLNNAIQVPMGNISRSAFNGVGSSAARQNFSIPLECAANVPVKVTLEGVNTPLDKANGILALTTDSVAAGIGLQLLYNDRPLALGSAVSYGTTVSDGTINIPFSARYYQTANGVSAGSANATATFTMTYQ